MTPSAMRSNLLVFLLICSMNDVVTSRERGFNVNLRGLASFLKRLITNPGSFETPMPDFFEGAEELILKEGYRFEKYQVVTHDGYILEIHRVDHPKWLHAYGPPVLIMPGFVGVSDTFVLRRDSLAFMLADAGYDVWMGNPRGTHYSRRHKTLNGTDKEFWDYSIHEVGYYDVPAFVDFVLSKTSWPKLFFIGYSMGNTALFIANSMRPEYNQKLIVSIAMTPVVSSLSHEDISSPLIRFLILNADLLYLTLNRLEVGEFLPRVSEVISLLHDSVVDTRTRPFVFDAFALVVGEHRNNIDQETFSIEGPHLPAGTSLKQFYHIISILKRGFFPLDLGPKMNLLKYNRATPPLYSLNSTTSPIVIFYSDNDPFVSVEAALKVAHTLPNVVGVQEMPTGYSHGDYFLGLDSSIAVNERIIHIFDRFSGKTG